MNKTVSTNQKPLIRRLPYTRMLKSEMAEYAQKVIEIVQKHDSASALFNPLFEALCEQKPKIELLSLNYGVDTDRLKLQEIKGAMMLTISSLKLKVRRLQFDPALDLHVIQNAIDAHLRYFNRCRNDKEVNHKIRGFLDLMQSNKEFAAAIDKFGLRENIREIEAINAHYNKVFINRVKRLARRPKFSTQEVIKELHTAIDNLFKGIEVAQLIYNSSGDAAQSGADYTPLINKLRQLSDMFYKSYAIRKANNRRKLEEGDEADMEVNASKTADRFSIQEQVHADSTQEQADGFSIQEKDDVDFAKDETAPSSAQKLTAPCSSKEGDKSNKPLHKKANEKTEQLCNATKPNGNSDNKKKPTKPIKLSDESSALTIKELLLRAGSS